MTLNLMYITNNPLVAKIAEEAGVDWIFIDLEINGKENRQGHLDTVISKHSLEDIKPIKDVLNKAKLLIRVNPIFNGSEKEINSAIKNGADIVMLPYFKSILEVRKFIKYVNKRAKVCLLLETPEAVQVLNEIINIEGIDMIHVGLNDLHLGYDMNFMFEPLANGMVERIGNIIKEKGIMFGFGGIAQIGQGALPAENIIIEHYRLGSNMVILSRGFCDMNKIKDIDEAKKIFTEGVKNIRFYEKVVKKLDERDMNRNREYIKEIVEQIILGNKGVKTIWIKE